MSKKKANGEGSITKRSDGRYMARYTANGKRHCIYGETHAEVREKLNQKLAEIARGEYIEPNKETVGKWMKEWLVTYALPTVKQSTYISYESYVRLHINPELGDIKLTALTLEQVQRFFNKKYAGTKTVKGLSPKSLKNIYNMFHAAIDQAIINQKIIRNPLLGVKLPKQQVKERRVLSAYEQESLQSVTKMAEELPAFGIIFALSTGVRLGELIGLKWSDVNFQTHSFRIRRTAGRLKKIDENGDLVEKTDGVTSTEIVVRTPKSAAAKREIPMFPELWEGLMEYREKQLAVKDAMGSDYNDEGYIFSTLDGRLYDPRVFEDLFKRKVALAQIDDTNFHALRHTFATRALEAGMDIKVLSSILGHAQASTTLNLYGHALPDHKKVSMDKMSGFYTGAVEIDTNADGAKKCKAAI